MKKVYTIQQAFIKAAKYCAYQERTQQEARQKIYSYGIFGDEAEEVICMLIEDNYINEERFAIAYAGGKFRIKKWGKVKIEQNLRQKGLSKYCINQGLAAIDEEEYEKTIEQLIEKKREQLSEDDPWKLRQKLLQFLTYRGFEQELIWRKIDQIDS